MNSYQKEQSETIFMVRRHLISLDAAAIDDLKNMIADYLLFRNKVSEFLSEHFSAVCNRKCYESKLSACCSREGIITFFGDVVVNLIESQDYEIMSLLATLEQPNMGFKCIYLGKNGCMWRVKPIVCEMFLCNTARQEVFNGNPRSGEMWDEFKRWEKLYKWPDRPVLFDDLETYFINAGFSSTLMYLHNNPGLLNVKRKAQILKKHA
ncbi:MAG: hypothetical protein J7K32_05515 [Deltaproteobacteria bacterium]|nr:hypothetical protein [Deltaproteobacteria bacterium]